MTEHNDDIFENKERLREAEIIVPRNKIKEKVGSGGISLEQIEKAEQALQQNETEFEPIADVYLTILDENLKRLDSGGLDGDDAYEAIFYPLVQLKAQGSLFKYPLITEIASMLINFLEVVRTLDDDVKSIIMAHKMTMRAVFTQKMDGSLEGERRQALTQALKDACMRYFQKEKI